MGNLIEFLGWVGSVEILLAYWLVSTERTHSKSLLYQVLNITGSAFFVLLGFYKNALPVIFLNLLWFAIGIFTLLQIYGILNPKKSKEKPKQE